MEVGRHRLRLDKTSIGNHATDRQEGTLLQKSLSLQRCIDSWTTVQLLYIPVINVICQRLGSISVRTEQPEDYPLCLPSAFAAASLTCDITLMEYEWKLRYAQAHDALHSLRQTLHFRSYLLKFKDRHLTGQGANTRARSTLKGVEAKISIATQRYHAARAALASLSLFLDKAEWQTTLRILKPEDIRSMMDMLDGDTEGRRIFSWIWRVHGASSDEDDRDGSLDAMRIEWCKARVRASRWTEEVDLLKEEMRRTEQFLEWHANWWALRAKVPHNTEHSLAEGLVAYAVCQASLRRALKTRFLSMWSPTLASYLEPPSTLSLS